MKIRSSLILLVLSLLFFSCGGGLSQEETGSVTMDAGRVAQHLARSAGIKARDVGSTFDGHGRDMDMASLYSLSMTVKLSTIGDYSASAQEKYKITMEEMAASDDAMESFFKTSLGKPITIEEIPVGSRIKVKAEVSFGQEFDEDAYRKILKNSGMPDAYINEALEGMKREVSSNMTTAEGYSQEFTVKSGPNYVTVKMAGDDFGDFGEGFKENELEILVYSKSDSAYKLQLRNQNGNKSLIADNAKADENSYIDTAFDNEGHIYVLYYADTDCFIYSNNPKFQDSVVKLTKGNQTFWMKLISFDTETNQLYGFSADEGNSVVCFKDLTTKGTITDDDYIITSIYDIPEFNSFCVNNNVVYAISNQYVEASWVGVLLNTFTLPGETTPVANQYTISSNNSEQKLNSGFELQYGGDTKMCHVKDMNYYDGNIQVLVQVNPVYTPNAVKYYVGGILNISTDNYEVTKKLFSEPVTIYEPGGDPFEVYQPSTIESKTSLFCPSRIIGIKPKKLIISDEGVFIYSNGTEQPDSLKNVNRIVTIDLDRFEIEDVDTESGETFEKDIEGIYFNTTPFTGTITSVD